MWSRKGLKGVSWYNQRVRQDNTAIGSDMGWQEVGWQKSSLEQWEYVPPLTAGGGEVSKWRSNLGGWLWGGTSTKNDIFYDQDTS